MHDMQDLKSAARRAGLERRKTAHLAASGAGARAAQVLLGWIGTRRFGVVSGYMPIRTEIDVLPAMHALHRRGAQICVPVILGKGQALEFRRWQPGCAMQPGAFGAMIPATAQVLVPDLLLCPLVAFDGAGNRMGYGGGFYDRSIAEIAAQKPLVALGYAYAGQQCAALPVEPTDQPLDAIITEKGVITPPS